ncbi:hypothetical protein MKX03_025036 [Papaver bracteatum]|nr:hypothetical protein MKX03_025036 [Papaver bracteatum]
MDGEMRKPFIIKQINSISDQQTHVEDGLLKENKESLWMVYLSTFVSIWGSFEYGTCVGYSSPTQAAITEELNLSLAEYSLFGSILTIGAMVGAITSGSIADFIGRKGAMRMSSAFCITGWLSIYFAKDALALDVGRLATGYGMGVFSYVAKIGKQREFEAALQQLRGKEADTSSEADEIQDCTESLQQLPQAKLCDLFQIRYLRSVTIGVGLMVCQQFGGINGVVFYLRQTFVSAGFPPDLGTTICAILPIFVTSLGVSLIDRAGRRALLLVSATGLVLGCLLAGAAFFMKDHELLLDAVPALTVTGILVYIGSFSIGMGAVPWVVMSEIFPINVKGVAGSLATLVSWFGTWVASYTYNYLMSWSTYGTFMIYAVINGLAIIFIARVVPETKGRTLEEIQAAINHHEEEQGLRK